MHANESRLLNVVRGALLGACLLLTTSAHAEDLSQAETLFREGRALLDQKKYVEACPKLAESQRLEPGAGTLLALALCHEGQGKLATAAAELKRASDLGRQHGRADLSAAAEKRARALAASVPHLVVHLPESQDLPFFVACDGEALQPGVLGAPLAMDPGEHRIEISAPGKVTRSYVVRISGPGTTEIVVDRLEDEPAPIAPKETPKEVSTQAVPVPDVDVPLPYAPTSTRGTAQRTLGVVGVGLGVVGLGAGAYFLGQGLSQSSEAHRLCPNDPNCAAADDANQRSKASFRSAVIALGAGTVVLTTGTLLYLLAPSARTYDARARTNPKAARVSPAFGPDGASLTVSGAF